MKKLIVSPSAPLKPAPPPLVLTIGCFDGIHLGHQSLIKALKAEAKSLKAKSCLCLLDPHPRKALNPGGGFKRLFTAKETESLLLPWGLDYFGVINFTLKFSRLPPEDFLRLFVKPRLNPKKIIAGHDFSFGAGGSGDFRLLKKLGHGLGIAARQIPAALYKKRPVSSSRIRRALARGQMGLAEAMLGRPFSLCGPVKKGEGRGSRLGFPTANLCLKGKFAPKRGVYAARARVIKGGKNKPPGQWMRAAVNIGCRPTFHGGGGRPAPALAEAHIIREAAGSPAINGLRGAELELALIRFLREERAFSGPEALKRQIKKDLQKTLKIF